MESLVKNLLYTYDNASKATVNYAKILKIPVSHSYLTENLQGHPDYPSLLAIYDTFRDLGAETVATKVSRENLFQITMPFMAQIQSDKQEIFTVVKRVSADAVTYLHPKWNSWVIDPRDKFLGKFTGVVVIADPSEVKPEKEYEKNIRKVKRGKMAVWTTALFLPSMVIAISILYAINFGVQALWPSLYLMLSLFGAFVCVLLVWHEVDGHNPLLKQVCSGGSRVNCGAILQSRASSIFGISWNVIGFTYFGGQLLTLLMAGISDDGTKMLLGYLSLTALSYVLFSVYYQWRIAKQWCVMCLAVQAVLLAQALAFLVNGRLPVAATIGDLQEFIRVAIAFFLPFVISSGGISLFRQVKEGRMHRNSLARLKHNTEIFKALLSKQKSANKSTEGLGITLGNPDAPNNIIKVCNPYCNPCAKAHLVLEEILAANTDVRVQIIFTADDSERDHKAPPARHILAIAEKGDERVTKRALNDWYNAEKKDYSAFATKYPMNEELDMQGHKLKAMREWCDKTEINFTPTLFVNGYQLPEMYTVDDLKYFFKP